MGNNTSKSRRLWKIASLQDGFFAARQAREVGYDTNGQAYQVKAGNWVREHRGIYRFVDYPLGERPDLMKWHLWSCNRKGEPQGIYSHETALSLYEVSDVNPMKIHMTVPKGFRRSAAIPKILVLHFGRLPREDTAEMHGVRVTTAIRTLVDVVTAGTLSRDILEQAADEFLRIGLVTQVSLAGRDWLGFAGIPAPSFTCISKEQQFAEKLHAYTMPDRPRPNSRVKDLVDMVLMIRRFDLDLDRLADAIHATFSSRDSHPLPDLLPAPPEDWAQPFVALAVETGLDVTIDEAFEEMRRFLVARRPA